MSAIKTDKLRILNAQQFVTGITTTSESYYTFIGLLNPTDYKSNWNQEPISPKDNFSEEYDYWDNMIALKKINSDDVRLVVKKNIWTSGTTYDMYRHDVSISKTSKPSGATSLFLANYCVINSNYDFYICLNNGVSPEYPSGRPSLDEPLFTDLEPGAAGTSGDGYTWKYLFSIKPNDIIKFDSKNYIPLPKTWGVEAQSLLIKNNAITSGQIKTILVSNRGTNVGPPNTTYTNVPIKGDGNGALATIVINNESKVQSITVSNGGSEYTYGTVDLVSGNVPLGTTNPAFDVIIPPQGGHGFDIYQELGAYRVMIQTIIENDDQNPDFITGNEYARIGIVQNPLQFNSNTKLSSDKVSALYALKLTGISTPDDYKIAIFEPDTIISQTVGTGITALGKVASYDSTTGVLKYWQDKTLAGFNFDGSQDQTPTYSLNMNRFVSTPSSGGSTTISGELSNLNLRIDTTFGTTNSPAESVVINNRTYQLGQSFIQGVSQPEVKKYSGNVLFVNQRPSILRTKDQKEYVKINILF
jgi:hypothetical protein